MEQSGKCKGKTHTVHVGASRSPGEAFCLLGVAQTHPDDEVSNSLVPVEDPTASAQ